MTSHWLSLLLPLSVSLAGLRAGWVDCWSVPNFLLIIDYTWHPIYPQKADEQLKQSCKMMTSYQYFVYWRSFQNVPRGAAVSFFSLSLSLLCVFSSAFLPPWVAFLFSCAAKCQKWRNPCCRLCVRRNTPTLRRATPPPPPRPLTAACPRTPRSCPPTGCTWRWRCPPTLRSSCTALCCEPSSPSR